MKMMSRGKKKAKAFEAGIATRKYEQVMNEVDSLSARLEKMPQAIAEAKKVLAQHSDDQVFKTYNDILEVREQVLAHVSAASPDEKAFADSFALYTERQLKFLPSCSAQHYKTYKALKAKVADILSAPTKEDMDEIVDIIKEMKQALVQVVVFVDKVISDINNTQKLRESREKQLEAKKAKDAQRAELRLAKAKAKQMAKDAKHKHIADTGAALRDPEAAARPGGIAHMDASRVAARMQTFDCDNIPAEWTGTTPCVILRPEALQKYVDSAVLKPSFEQFKSDLPSSVRPILSYFPGAVESKTRLSLVRVRLQMLSALGTICLFVQLSKRCTIATTAVACAGHVAPGVASSLA